MRSAAYLIEIGFGYESFIILSFGPERSPLAISSKNSVNMCLGTFIEFLETSNPLMKSNQSALNESSESVIKSKKALI